MTTNMKTKTCSHCRQQVVSDSGHCPRCMKKFRSRWPWLAVGLAAILVASSAWALLPGAHF